MTVIVVGFCLHVPIKPCALSTEIPIPVLETRFPGSSGMESGTEVWSWGFLVFPSV